MAHNGAELKPIAPKRARFVAEYLIDRNATQAAIRAGYSAKTAYSQGQRLLRYDVVREAVASGEAEIAASLAITVEGVAAQLDEDRALALANNQAGAAVSASMGKAKLAGLLVDRQDVTGTVSVERIERLIVDPGPVIEHEPQPVAALDTPIRRAADTETARKPSDIPIGG
jgi:hypothetical protein